jgi:putative ABC transport system permease protein
VRVAGVRGIDALSRERVRLAADRIRRATGLDVDLTVGASSAPEHLALPAGVHGRPALSLQSSWTKKGVGLAILSAVDRKSLLLFALILVVCALFVANATAAATAARRTELGVLSALGWPPARVAVALLADALVVGAAAGVLGAILALAGSRLLGVDTHVGNAALAAPSAVALCLATTLASSVRAVRISPIAAIRPAVASGRRAISPAGPITLAISNARRTPLRSALGALSLTAGVLAITLVLGLTFQFRGALAGTVLGEVVSVRVRSADVVAAITTMVLGGVAVADMLYLNIRERAAELATLRALGWTDGRIATLITSEAVVIGVVGALPGAALGLLATATLAGGIGAGLVLATAASALAGTAVAACGGLLAAASVRRLSTTSLLAEE